MSGDVISIDGKQVKYQQCLVASIRIVAEEIKSNEITAIIGYPRSNYHGNGYIEEHCRLQTIELLVYPIFSLFISFKYLERRSDKETKEVTA